ncbi:MAG: cbb3-type cytochrome c oxidase subunit I [Steroidobacteraceae bacterium]
MTRSFASVSGPAVGSDPISAKLVAQSGLSRLARGWLWLGLLALAGSGVFAVLLVLSRTPQLNQLLPVADFFRVALIVHVDLSVLVWLVSLAGLLWTISGSARAPGLAWLAFGLCAAGTALMALAPFTGQGGPVMANYIPVVDGPIFLAGLAVFGLGSAALVLRGLIATQPTGPGLAEEGALRFGVNTSVVAAAVAVLSFCASLLLVPRSLDTLTYFEILFWGGGHALQFVWTILMLVGWLWLARATGVRVSLSPRLIAGLFALALVSVFVTPLAYLAADVTSVEFRLINTWAMRLGGGVAIAPIALAVLAGLLRSRVPRDVIASPLFAALVSSIMLFSAGGVIGALISGNNVRIPAHYHGCIVGVTLALMGLVYLLLPRLGYRAANSRLAYWQPILYGSGQLLHIIGLVWSGGYGVQRKVAGAEQVLRSTSEVVGMGLMGLGGLIAIIGGLLFVLVVLRSIRGDGVAVGASE